jgi:hypothetical protein
MLKMASVSKMIQSLYKIKENLKKKKAFLVGLAWNAGWC